jgi:uncharacterized alkaline shock family protein YloU
MTTTPAEKTSADGIGAPRTRVAGAVSSREGGQLSSDLGKTSIADTVVAKIVGMAAREIPGIYGMGAGLSRTLGAVRDRLPGVSSPGVTQGVTVEVGERQAAVDLDLIIEYGSSIPDVAAGVRRNVVHAVEKMCGLDVVEVNITIDDVHMPSDDTAEAAVAGSRVE